MLHYIAGKPMDTVCVDIFMMNNKMSLCNLDYNSKFSVMKLMDGFTTDSLIKTCKIIFAEDRLPKNNT